MKLKFRAEKKDVVAYAWACLLLLCIVSFCVVNLYHVSSSMSQSGITATDTGFKFSFNILLGFFPPRLGYTLLFWIVTVVVLTLSVSSRFYSREKGFGFVEGKKEDGFGRFAKEDEYKKFRDVEPVEITAREATAAGFPLVYDKKQNLAYVDNGEFHSLVIGATGSGKTQMVINPLVGFLAKKGESMVITDPKAEIYDKNAEMLKDMGYNVIVVNFRDPQNGSCWNPYTLPYKYYKEGNQDKANELLNDMAINIATDEKADDPFWTNSAADYLTGLSLGMFEDAKEDEISISTVNLMMTVGDEKIGSSTYLKEYFKMKDPASPAAINALGTINAPQDTKNSIDSVLKQKIKVFAVTQNLSEMLSRSDFDVETIGEKKTAVFMVVQDEKTTYHALATIFIKQCYECLIAVAQRHGGKLPVRTNFLLDEFANMPKFKDITTMITAARSRQIRMTMIIQNFAQLVQVYGKEDAETIRGNCGDMLYLLTGELSALEEISKLCGDKIVKVGKDKKEETRPLITVPELQRFKDNEVLVLKHRLPPLRTKFLPFWDTDFGYGKNNSNVSKAELPTHEKRDIKLFDIREFVKKKKEEQRNELFGSASSNPFGGGTGTMNPFGNTNNSPFGNNPFMNNSNPFDKNDLQGINPFSKPVETKENSESLNIDDLVKKIDAKIAELEEEEKKENEAKNNEEQASLKPTINEESSSSIITNNDSIKDITFPSFNPVINSKEHDIMDDYLEDLSIDDELEALQNEQKQAEIKKSEEPKASLESITVDNVKENNLNDNIYTNKEEVDKIMNEKDDDDPEDIFDDFFE